MDGYVAHANIDHYFRLLTGEDISDHNRAVIIKLMIAEEDRLGRQLEHLQFAEDRTARSRDRVHHLRRLRDTFADGTNERVHADRLLATFATTHELMEQFCRRMRERVNSSPI